MADSWLNTKVTTSKPKTRRGKVEKIIINPTFKDYANLTDDVTWKTILDDAAYNNFPRGFSYRNNYLTHKIRNKVSKIELSDNAEVATSECIKFFKEKGGIMSQDDQDKSRQDLEDYIDRRGNQLPSKWSEIRKGRIKEVLISAFISRLSKEMQLSSSEKDSLRNVISIGFILGCFTKNHIILTNGSIEGITGLKFDNEKRKFYIDYHLAPINLKVSKNGKAPPIPKQSFYAVWLKFISSLGRKINANDISSFTDNLTSAMDELTSET